ncbi:ECF transporter S component [Candidatus Lokiarchaeum ossiferum]|uniref:ECF transporter S component n=1 Tax=Candidatus Lokiarchaeum ossiferum TaxID=2951803 RepID=UPI00352BD822
MDINEQNSNSKAELDILAHKNHEFEEEHLIDTGNNALKKKGKKSSYFFTTQDLLIASILGIMGGFISGLIPFSLLIKTWYPFVGGTQLVSGHHLLWMVIAYGLTGKKRTIFVTATIQGFMNFLFGSSWGIMEVGITLYEGIFLFIGMYLMQLFGESDTKLGWAIAAGIGNLSQVPLFWIITGKIYILHWSLFVMAMMFGFLSGILIAGVLGYLIVERIKKTGVI